jgi:fructose-1,6-bisphosphatase
VALLVSISETVKILTGDANIGHAASASERICQQYQKQRRAINRSNPWR